MRLGYNYLSLKTTSWDHATNIFTSIFDASISRINANNSDLDLEGLYNQIALDLENEELSSLRDWLLPMLMNGQLTIKEAEEQLSMAAEPENHYEK